MQDLIGKQLGNYIIEERLGVGGMGAVFRARQVTLDRAVAIKVLTQFLAAEEDSLRRFKREAQTVSQLDGHPNIVSIIDFGADNDITYVVMPLMSGGSLMQHLKKGRIYSPREISDVLRPLASALDFAHANGIVHRDIKPANIMFDHLGSPQIVDFGIAKLLSVDASAITAQSAFVGTPAYTAPEQWRSDMQIVPATDQYALAVVVYLMMTGEVPYPGTTPHQLMFQHLMEAPEDLPAEIDPDGRYTAVLQRALHKEPGQRYPSVMAFADAYDAVVTAHESGIFVAEDNAPGTDNAPPTTRASWVTMAAAAVVIVLIGVVLAIAITQGRDDDQPAQVGLVDTSTATASAAPPTTVAPVNTLPPSPTTTKTLPPVATATHTATVSSTPSPTQGRIEDLATVAQSIEDLTIMERWRTRNAQNNPDTALSAGPDVATSTVAVFADANPSPTSTATATATAIPSLTASATATASATGTASATATPSLTATTTATATLTRTQRPTRTVTASASPQPTEVAQGIEDMPVIVDATVNVRRANLRSGPGTDYDVVAQRDEGDALGVMGHISRDGRTWLLVRLQAHDTDTLPDERPPETAWIVAALVAGDFDQDETPADAWQALPELAVDDIPTTPTPSVVIDAPEANAPGGPSTTVCGGLESYVGVGSEVTVAVRAPLQGDVNRLGFWMELVEVGASLPVTSGPVCSGSCVYWYVDIDPYESLRSRPSSNPDLSGSDPNPDSTDGYVPEVCVFDGDVLRYLVP